jgi:hypothetical protein
MLNPLLYTCCIIPLIGSYCPLLMVVCVLRYYEFCLVFETVLRMLGDMICGTCGCLCIFEMHPTLGHLGRVDLEYRTG